MWGGLSPEKHHYEDKNRGRLENTTSTISGQTIVLQALGDK